MKINIAQIFSMIILLVETAGAQKYSDTFTRIMSDTSAKEAKKVLYSDPEFDARARHDLRTVYESSQVLEGKPRYLIDVIMFELKKLVNETSFDHVRFYKEFEKLTELLLETNTVLKSILYPSEDLRNSYNFATHLFLVMVDAEDKFNELHYQDTPDRVLVCMVIELNVRALVLMDSWGSPDLMVSNYESKVNTLVQNLYLCEVIFKEMEEALKGIRTPFWKYVDRAQRSVRLLQFGMLEFENSGR